MSNRSRKRNSGYRAKSPTRERFVGKFRVNTSHDANVFQSLEFKVGYNDHLSDETYLGLTAADFELNPQVRFGGSR